MARPKKQTVDYFPHSVDHQTTMFIIEQRYGNDGYSFWFKLLECLGAAPGHYLDLTCDMKWEFLQAKTRLDSNSCEEILNLLSKLSAIDPVLWSKRIVWSQNFVDGIADVYRNRRVEIPQRPEFPDVETNPFHEVSTPDNTQSKVKETKVKKTKEYTERFLAFYDLYPRKEAKAKAKESWNKISVDAPLFEQIKVAVAKQIKYKAHLTSTNQFCPEWPHPATWLNQRRWEDEIPEIPKSKWESLDDAATV